MRVEILYFASLKERTGTARETVEVDPALTLVGLWERLIVLHPRLREVVPHPAAACDREYCSWDRSLQGVREVAFLPPVSGG